jgi:hypothetical protein
VVEKIKKIHFKMADNNINQNQSNHNYENKNPETTVIQANPYYQQINTPPLRQTSKTVSFSPADLKNLKTNIRQQNYNPSPQYNNQEQLQQNNSQLQNQNLSQNNPAYNMPINSDFGVSFGQPETPQNQIPIIAKKNSAFLIKLKSYLPLVKKLVIGFFVFLALASLVAAAFLFINKTAPTKNLTYDKIKTEIIAPTRLAQGTPAKWTIKISNDQEYAIDDVTLELKYDQDFQTTDFPNYKPFNGNNIFKIGKLDQFGVGTQNSVVDIEGFLNAQVDVETSMSGVLSFYPVKDNGSKADEQKILINPQKTKVTSPEIQLTITPTIGSVQNGGEAEYVIKVKNTKETDYQDLKLKIGYPAGNIFTYSTSQFTASNTAQKIVAPSDGDDTWYISRLAGLSEQVLSIKGKVNVKSEQKVPLKATLSKKSNTGEYKDLKTAIKDIQVTNQPIIITTSLEKSGSTFASGENLKVNIDYFNQSQETLKNVEILGFVNDKSNLLDLSSIAFNGGNRPFIDNSQIQWTGNNTPQLVSLVPQSKGRLSYSINIKKNVIDFTKKQKEYVITPQVQIKAINLQEIVAIGQEYKMDSSVIFAQGETEEVNIENNTNINKKRYKIAWSISNEQNEIGNIEIRTRTNLPPSAFIQSSIIKPQSSTLSYNPGDGEIVFKLDQIPSYTGIDPTKKPLYISFEFEIDQQITNLIEAPTLTAIDNFTDQSFKITGKPSEAK